MSYQLINDVNNLPNVVNTMNKNIYELKNREVVQVYRDTTGTRRIILGRLPDGSYGFAISKDGSDVVEILSD